MFSSSLVVHVVVEDRHAVLEDDQRQGAGGKQDDQANGVAVQAIDQR